LTTHQTTSNAREIFCINISAPHDANEPEPQAHCYVIIIMLQPNKKPINKYW
jgi:hypothetical protein